MRMWKKVLLCLLATITALVAGLYIFLSTNGRRLFNEQMSSLTNRKVTVLSIAPKLPGGLVLKGLTVAGLLSAQRVKVMVDPLALVGGRVKILSVVMDRPVLWLERGADARLKLAPGQAAAVPASGSVPLAAAPAAGVRSVIIHYLSVADGEVRLRDVPSGREWSVTDIKGEVRDIPLTGDAVRTAFSMSASLANLDIPLAGRSLRAGGWLNWAARDMDASAQVVDGKGLTGLDVKLVARANVLSVQGHVRMTLGGNKPAGTSKSGLAEDVVSGVLGALTDGIEADFSFQTALDHFELGKIAFKGKATTGLNSAKTLGTIVEDMRGVGEELLKKEAPVNK